MIPLRVRVHRARVESPFLIRSRSPDTSTAHTPDTPERRRRNPSAPDRERGRCRRFEPARINRRAGPADGTGRGAETRRVSATDQRPLTGHAAVRPRLGASAPQARRLLSAIAGADGLVLASPAYHGGISGLVKNALDHVEELREDTRPYLSERAVGCVAVAHGWQGAVSTLAALRDVTHALRGWPTPLGAAINTSTARFSPAAPARTPTSKDSWRK
ncbi:NADPH-dependent FMN reductase [Streptomyces nogalater]